jgi:hypothetical protein
LAKKGSRISKAERASSQDTPATANLEGEIYKFASKLTWLGIIEAKTEGEAIEIARRSSQGHQALATLIERIVNPADNIVPRKRSIRRKRHVGGEGGTTKPLLPAPRRPISPRQ